jgi:serine/threonine-protein kinase
VPTAAELAPGELIDSRFRLVREIAAGAMGAVWEAEDLVGRSDAPSIAKGARVALKVLRPELHAEISIRRRFRREASILKSITHPAVVRILDVGHATDHEHSYTVMELLHGETLESRLAREKKISPRALAPLLDAIAGGLSAVHAHGVIHGDLKPSNIFLADDEGKTRLKIVDFGLSKIEGLERLTRTGELTGTPLYLAPELLKGERQLDARLDQYAIAVVLYEALTGQLPFEARKHPGALMFDIVMGKSKPLAAVAPELGEAISAIVTRAMAPSPESRFPDMAAFSAAFAKAIEGVD